MLAPAAVVNDDATKRRILFPLLLGSFLGMAALHIVLFARFGGSANLLFAATVGSVFLDWFVWLGGPHDLGLVTTVEATALLSTITWLTATLAIVHFLPDHLHHREPALASHAAMLGSFACSSPPTWDVSPAVQLLCVNLFLVLSAGIILANAVSAVRRAVPGVRLALAAYGIALANELLTFGSLSIPWLAALTERLAASFGMFDVGTLLSQVLTNGLFSLALWEQARVASRERDAALVAERLKTAHVAQNSHDIRSPLQAVQSAIGALASRAWLGGAAPEPVEMVQASVRSVVAMLDELVALARTGERRGDRPDIVDVRQVVADTAAIARAGLAGRPVALQVRIADDVPSMIGGDALAIRRVLGNLVSNAVRATDRGAVTISVSAHSSAPHLRFEIADTGAGMLPEQMAVLVHPRPEREGPSTGLGLKVARRLVDAMQGSVGASTRPGGGTSVWFEVPAPPAPTVQSSSARPMSGTVPRLRVLLAEDDRLAAAATGVLLTIDGHDVLQAATVAEAVRLADLLPLDLVLMDLGLDRGSGLDAIGAIRALADPGRSGVPIVVVSGDREGPRWRSGHRSACARC